MKNIVKFFLPILVLGFMTACSSSPDGKKVEAGKAAGTAAQSSAGAATYKVNTGSSGITWTGSKVGGMHMGKLKLSDGNIAVKGGNIEAGSFTIDMNSLTNTDLKAGQGKEKLEGHLKTGDFFEVEKYPTGTFTITNVAKVSGNASMTHKITGDLELKGVKKSVTFDANVNVGGNSLTAVTESFTIDRTEWGIKFMSGVLGTAKDKAVNDDIGLVININAAK